MLASIHMKEYRGRGASGRSQMIPCPGSSKARLPYRLRRLLLRGMGLITGSRERTFWDCTRLSMGGVEEEPKAGRGSDLGGLGRNKYGKIEIGLQKGLLAYRQAAWSIFLPGHAPHLTIASCPAFSLNTIPDFSWVRTLFCVQVCVWGSACSN